MSSRQRPCALLFGTPPPELLFGHHDAIAAHVHALRRAGIEEIALVASVGSGCAAARLPGVRVVLHSGAWNSPFDEVVLGLFALGRAPVLVLPIDHEVVREDTLLLLVSEAERAGAVRAIVPLHGKRTGYPVVLFEAGVDAVIREAAKADGPRLFDSVVQSWSEGVRILAVADANVANELTARA